MTPEQLAKLTPEEKRAKLFELLGWTQDDGFMLYDGEKLHFTMWIRGTEKVGDDRMPDYLNDLNATHEMEKVLEKDTNWRARYWEKLHEMESGESPPANGHWCDLEAVGHAEALSKADAFLLTVDGKEAE